MLLLQSLRKPVDFWSKRLNVLEGLEDGHQKTHQDGSPQDGAKASYKAAHEELPQSWRSGVDRDFVEFILKAFKASFEAVAFDREFFFLSAESHLVKSMEYG